jgi:hypothetical protein
LHNLATVVTPNIFRPYDLTANDLIFAGHLVDSLKMMITDCEDIFITENNAGSIRSTLS